MIVLKMLQYCSCKRCKVSSTAECGQLLLRKRGNEYHTIEGDNGLFLKVLFQRNRCRNQIKDVKKQISQQVFLVTVHVFLTQIRISAHYAECSCELMSAELCDKHAELCDNNFTSVPDSEHVFLSKELSAWTVLCVLDSDHVFLS